MASGFSTKTGKKYGFVSAADVKIAGPRGANVSSASHHMGMHRVGVVRSWSPGMTSAGEHYAGMIPSGQTVNQKIGGGIQRFKQAREQTQQNRMRAMQQGVHPSQQEYQSNPAALPAHADYYQYYQAPRGGMGAVVPESRSKKFAQGRGSPTSP